MQVFKPAKHSAETDNNTVQVLRDEIKEKKIGSLYVADRAVELANTGEVRAVTDGSQFKFGDKVVFTKYAGSELPLDGGDGVEITYILLKEREIQGWVTEVNVGQTKREKDDLLQKALAQFEATGRG